MTEDRTYADFDLLIEGVGEEAYRARVLDSPAGEAAGAFSLPFSDLELEVFLLKVGRPRRGVRRLESPEMEAAREFGTQLFDAVFQDDVRLSLRRSLDEAERRDEGLRIRLRFSNAPELSSLPWEFMFSESDDQFLVLSAWTPIIRYLDLTQPIEPLTVTGPLRVLAMISSPHDYPQLDVEDEWRRIESSLEPLIDRGSVVVERCDDATLLELQRRLRRGEYHIFHFLGHGGFDESADDGVLVLEDGNNRSRLVAGRDVGTILSDHRSLRLAVLNACEGARAAESDPFTGAAQSLVRKGIPGVVAMQFEITDTAAIAFAHEFYGAIADGLPVDAAIGESRRAIFGQGNDIEWGTPVVYLRGDGRLFEVVEAAQPEAPVGAAVGAAAVLDEIAEPDLEAEVVEEVEAVEPEPEAEQVEEPIAAVPVEEESKPEPVETEDVSAGAAVPAATGWRRLFDMPKWALWLLMALAIFFVFVVVYNILVPVETADDGTETTFGSDTTTQVTQATSPTTVIAQDGSAVASQAVTPMLIDGSDNDWTSSHLHTTDHVFYQARPVREDPSARAGDQNESLTRLAWDDTHLYVLAEVEDDIVNAAYTDPTQIWRFDAVNLNVSGLPDGRDHQITLSPGDQDAGIGEESAHYVVGGSTLNTGFAQVVALPTQTGYVLEARIPWSELDITPQAGDELVVLLSVFDNDGEPFAQAEITANLAPGGEPLDERWFRDPAAWGTLELAP